MEWLIQQPDVFFTGASALLWEVAEDRSYQWPQVPVFDRVALDIGEEGSEQQYENIMPHVVR